MTAHEESLLTPFGAVENRAASMQTERLFLAVVLQVVPEDGRALAGGGSRPHQGKYGTASLHIAQLQVVFVYAS